MDDITFLKQYIRIDTDDDDNLLKQLKEGAECFLKNAGVSVGYENPLYCTAINMIVANWYDNREIENTLQFQNMISQLAYQKRG